MSRYAAPVLVVIALLNGCSTYDSAPRSDVVANVQWLASGGALALQRDWWAGFGDATLTQLVEQALQRNLDLRQAVARLAESRALTAAQDAASMPTLDFGAGAERSRSISEVVRAPYLSTVHQTQFQATYEVDLWGKVQALTSAAELNSEAASAARDVVALSIASSVAAGYINLLALDAQLDLAQRTLGSREQSLALTQRREKAGYGSALESAQAEAELHATAQVIPQIELARQRQERALNVLLGQSPAPIARGLPLRNLTARGPASAGIPSELLRHRPDIASAELQVAAADAQLAAARAQMLPSLRLSAALGRVGSTVLQGDPFSIWSVGGSVLAPLFNGGRLRSFAQASASRRDQALIAYERTVLTAFAEVETTLTSFARENEQLVEVHAQRNALEKALHIAERRRREGYASYLDELLAQRALFAAERSVLELSAGLLQTEVAIYRALGGGWHRAASDEPALTVALRVSG